MGPTLNRNRKGKILTDSYTLLWKITVRFSSSISREYLHFIPLLTNMFDVESRIHPYRSSNLFAKKLSNQYFSFQIWQIFPTNPIIQGSKYQISNQITSVCLKIWAKIASLIQNKEKTKEPSFEYKSGLLIVPKENYSNLIANLNTSTLTKSTTNLLLNSHLLPYWKEFSSDNFTELKKKVTFI